MVHSLQKSGWQMSKWAVPSFSAPISSPFLITCAVARLPKVSVTEPWGDWCHCKFCWRTGFHWKQISNTGDQGVGINSSNVLPWMSSERTEGTSSKDGVRVNWATIWTWQNYLCSSPRLSGVFANKGRIYQGTLRKVRVTVLGEKQVGTLIPWTNIESFISTLL